MKNETNEKNFDIIFIGSGMGTLTAASIFAQHSNKKVLIIEKHFQPGGYTHQFQRKSGKYHWDVGIHYVGDLEKGTFMRRLSDRVTQGGVNWVRMNEPFEKFVYPNQTFSVFGTPERYMADLITMFPEEKEAIEKYFKDIKKTSVYFGRALMTRASAPPLESFVNLTGDRIHTTKEYMDKHFKSQELKAILESQWGDYGLPPSRSSFLIHAQVVQHYMNGGFYPEGGAGTIFDSVDKIISEKGGMTLSSTEVTEIIIKDGKAVGVKTRHLRGEKEENEYHAPIIISGAGAYITYLRLLPEAVPISFKESLKNFYSREKMATSVCLYLGLKESPAKLGFRGENYWIYSSYDHDEMFEKRNDWVEGKDEVVGAYLSFPSLKDPKATHHTADLIAFTDYKNFAKWKEQPWKKRDEEYKALKENIANKLLDFIEKRFPGFKDLVDFQELSTPVTNEHFTSHVDGAIYGLACVPERYDKTKCPWFETKTPIEGLYLTGADVASPGISGAMIGGLATVLAIHGSGDIIKWI